MRLRAEHHHVASNDSRDGTVVFVMTDFELDSLNYTPWKRARRLAVGPFLFLRVFSDDQAGSRDHDPCDKGGLTREQQRFGEDSGHVAPRM
jgi:hypothetical protein